MNQKLTIGIDLDAHVQKALTKSIKQWNGLPVRFHAPESYHIPLVSLGWVHEDLVPDIIEALTVIATTTPIVRASFVEIAPVWKKKSHEGDIRQAHALWCRGEVSEDLRLLYEQTLDALKISHADIKSFSPHIVLGQMRKLQWEKMEELPEMRVDFPFELDVAHLTLFEQTVEDGKKIFLPLEVFELQ